MSDKIHAVNKKWLAIPLFTADQKAKITFGRLIGTDQVREAGTGFAFLL